jgi:predicted acyl esterase
MRDGVRIALDVMLPPPERYDLAAGVPCVLAQTRVRHSGLTCVPQGIACRVFAGRLQDALGVHG